MIICLSGFVIAGTSPTSLSFSSRNDICVQSALGAMGAMSALGGARYSPHQQQLLQHFTPPPRAPHRGAGRSSSSSAESVSSHSASPPPPPPAAPLPPRRVRTLYACLGESEGELSFEPNQIISHVEASGEPGWLRGELAGRLGLVPENYVEPLP